MATIKCPHCGKEVRIISFGNGYIGVCCNQIIYSSYKLPLDNKEYISFKDLDKPS